MFFGKIRGMVLRGSRIGRGSERLKHVALAGARTDFQPLKRKIVKLYARIAQDRRTDRWIM